MSRLNPLDSSRELYPWVRTTKMTRCCLYWMPVRSFPVPAAQRDWLMAFLDNLVPLLTKTFKLRTEVFLQFKAIHPDLTDVFLNAAQDLCPLLGLTRKPGSTIPPAPSVDEIRELVESGKPIDVMKLVTDYCYWFLAKAEKRQRELFLGRGALTMLFLKPDPKTAPPPIMFPRGVRKHAMFQAWDVEGIHGMNCSMADEFLPKSKQLFGDDLKGNPQLNGLAFIIPLLATADFFSQPQALIENCFQLFDIYINESPSDRGILLASKHDLDEILKELLKTMTDQGVQYPET